MDLIPVNERIVVVPKEVETRGILLPQSAKLNEKPEVGFVVAIDSSIEKPKCHIGDKIIFNRYATTDITYQEKRYLIMMESSVMAIFKNVTQEEKDKYL